MKKKHFFNPVSNRVSIISENVGIVEFGGVNGITSLYVRTPATIRNLRSIKQYVRKCFRRFDGARVGCRGVI